MVVFIIGLPGCGKTTFGKMLSKKINFSFRDLDELIEKKNKQTLSQFINQKGEESFRLTEAEMLEEMLSLKNTVVACGGGTPCFYDNMELMNALGITIFLNIPVETVFKQLNNEFELKKRPLLNIDKLQELFDERKKYYNEAQISVFSTDENALNFIQLELEKLL